MTATAMALACRNERLRPSASPASPACVASAPCASRPVAVLCAMALTLASALHPRGVRGRPLPLAPATLSSTA